MPSTHLKLSLALVALPDALSDTRGLGSPQAISAKQKKGWPLKFRGCRVPRGIILGSGFRV